MERDLSNGLGVWWEGTMLPVPKTREATSVFCKLLSGVPKRPSPN